MLFATIVLDKPRKELNKAIHIVICMLGNLKKK